MADAPPADTLVLAFAPLLDTPGKRDVTGAFLPEAQKFCKLRGGTLYRVGNRGVYPKRAKEVLRALRSHFQEGVATPLPGSTENAPERLPGASTVKSSTVVAFFCHGTYGGSQLGFRAFAPPRNVPELAVALSETPGPLTVLLYACLNGQEGGFAEMLSKALKKLGKPHRIFAHTTAGHTTKNPYVVVYTDGVAEEPRLRRENPKAWRARLRTDDRFRLDLL